MKEKNKQKKMLYYYYLKGVKIYNSSLISQKCLMNETVTVDFSKNM